MLSRGARSGSGAGIVAATASLSLLEPAAAAVQSLSLLRCFGATQSSSQFEDEVGVAPASVQQQQQQGYEWRLAAARQQQRRRLSHYAASTSALATPPTLIRSAGAATAAAARGGHGRPFAPARWRAFSSSSAAAAVSAAAVAPAKRGASPERSFASQPNYAYSEEPQVHEYHYCGEEGEGEEAASAAAAAAAPLLRVQAAVASLKAKAEARLAEARATRPPASFGVPAAAAAAPNGSQSEAFDLVRVPQVEELAPQAPVWERLARYCGSSSRGQSSAALHHYRQEVLHGQDAEALSQGVRGGYGHVPFLISGLFAAQQGFGLQSELSRDGLPARLVPPSSHGQDESQGTAVGMSQRTRSALEGLHLAMDLSRACDADQQQEQQQQQAAHLLAAAEAVAAAAAAHRGVALPEGLLNGSSTSGGGVAALRWGQAQAGQQPGLEEEGSEAGVAAGAAAHDEAGAEAEAELFEPQGSLLEGLEWEARQLRLHSPNGSSTAAPRRRRRMGVRAQQQQQRSHREVVPPAVPADEVLEALQAVPGVRMNRRIDKAVQSLYIPGRWKAYKLAPLEQPEEPQAFLQQMREMTRLLTEELGSQGFEEVVCAHPWVLLLDPSQHGHLQLAALHLVDLSQKERASIVRAFPRVLQTDVDAGLLPTLEYLQSLGMTNDQMAYVLKTDPNYCNPITLDRLKSMVSFWRGKGLSREGMVQLIMVRPNIMRSSITECDLKLAFLADHVGMAVEEMPLFGTCLYRSLTNFIGPRVAFAMHKGFKVTSSVKADIPEPELGLRRVLFHIQAQYLRRLGATEEEYQSFRSRWMQRDFPAWVETRRPGIEHYRTLTGPRHPRKQQQQQQ